MSIASEDVILHALSQIVGFQIFSVSFLIKVRKQAPELEYNIRKHRKNE